MTKPHLQNTLATPKSPIMALAALCKQTGSDRIAKRVCVFVLLPSLSLSLPSFSESSIARRAQNYGTVS